ncbi:ankyrin repeat-containing domain protein [Tuber brumale]|nr:ankyrin repeat-containing domain protein [Tuber brumale]
MTPLISATLSGRETIVKLLLASEAVRKWRAVDDMDNPPMHFATTCGVPEILRVLLETPTFDVNLPGSLGWTPLHSAAVFGKGTSVSLLLTHPEIDVNAVDIELSTPLISAVRSSVVNNRALCNCLRKMRGLTLTRGTIRGGRCCIGLFRGGMRKLCTFY